MSRVKRILSLLMAVCLIATAVPATAFAEKEATAQTTQETTQATEADASIENEQPELAASNDLGQLLNAGMTEAQVEDAGEETEEYQDGYGVYDLLVEGNAALVEYSTLEDAKLIVAVYEEESEKLVYSATADVTKDETSAVVEFEGSVPEYFLAEAYLVDNYDHSPLCMSYETTMYTKEVQALLNSTVEDYDEEQVLQLTEDTTNNFLVFADWVKVIAPVEGVNTVVSADDETATYVIENADENFTGLQAGDTFVYEYSEEDIIITEVVSIAVDGTTVTITGTEVSDEVLSDVKIVPEDVNTYGARTYASDSGNKTLEPIVYPLSKLFGDGVEGEATITFGARFEYIKTSSRKMVELAAHNTINIEWAIAKTKKYEKKLEQITIPICKGIDVVFTPTFIVEFNGEVTGEIELYTECGFSYDNNRSKGKEWVAIKPIPSVTTFELDAEGYIYAGLVLEPGVEVLKVLEATLTCTVGLKLHGEMHNEDWDGTGCVKHSCPAYKCIEGDLYRYLDLKGKVDFGWFNIVDKTLIEGKDVKVADCYLRLDTNEWGFSKTCPNRRFPVTFNVKYKGSAKKNAQDAMIYTGKTSATNYVTSTTDKSGNATFWLPAGEYGYNLCVAGDFGPHIGSYTIGEDSDTLVSIPRTLGYTYLASGSCGVKGSSVKWLAVKSAASGEISLVIYGIGEMKDYEYSTDIPWYSYDWRENIKYVRVAEGVTKVGTGAFCDCSSLERIDFPETLTTLGRAIMGGTNVKVINIPKNVKTIAQYDDAGQGNMYASSFNNAYALEKIVVDKDNKNYSSDERGVLFNKNKTILYIYPVNNTASDYTVPSGVKTIYNCAFFQSKLKNLKLPNTVTKLGIMSFEGMWYTEDCRITIPKGVTTIPTRAFHFSPFKEIVVPSSVHTIEEMGLIGIAQSIVLSEGLKTIGDYGLVGTNDNTIEIPTTVRYIGEDAITSQNVYFKGDAPTFHANAFQDDTITAYYPKGNPTWTKAKRKSYGGTVTWKSYNPNTQYASVSETSDALLSLSDVSASGKFEDVLELQDMMVEDFVVVDVVPEETVVEDFDTGINTYALYQGVTSSDGTTNSASFTGLVPGENYLILSLVSEEVEDIFASDNLLYIAQETAAEDGTLSVSYLPRTASETCSVIACGASSKNLKDATISFPEMAGNADIEQVAVPTIIYGEAELEAGTDYVVVKGGVYTAPGTYEMTIRGVKNYSGLVTVSYTVGTPLCGDETSGVEHNYKDVVTAPTCTEQGYTTYTCICGDTYVDDYVDAMHTRGEGVVTTEPTEEAVGVMTYTCTVCGADETEEIPMLEHVHDFTYTSKSEATCTTHGFDTYTCKCLETYDDIFADPLGHDYKNGVCTVCGDYYLKFTSASLTLQDNLSINFKVRKALFDETGWENPYVVFDLNGKESVVTEYREVDDDYVFDFVNIAPNQMNDLISATLYAEKDGEVGVSLPVEYGVAKYSYNMLSRYTDDAYAEFRTLLVDLLNYGAQSQSYTGYNTDNLVNASLTEAQKAWGTAENREYVSVLDTAYETVENPIATWKGAGLNLKDRVEIRLTLEARNPGNLVVKARTEDGKEWEMPAGWFEPVSDGRYYVYFNGLNAGQMSEPVYFTVYEGDTVVSNTLRYSIESYVYSQSNKTAPDESLLALLKTMMKYGDAAHNYITE